MLGASAVPSAGPSIATTLNRGDHAGLCGKYEAVCKYGDVLKEAEFPLDSALRPLTVAGRLEDDHRLPMPIVSRRALW